MENEIVSSVPASQVKKEDKFVVWTVSVAMAAVLLAVAFAFNGSPVAAGIFAGLAVICLILAAND